MDWSRVIIFLTLSSLVAGEETSNVTESTTTSATTSTQASTTLLSTTMTTTTAVPSTQTPSTKKPTTPPPLPSKRTTFLNTTGYACSCDLTIACDVNCCCDIDCSEEFIKAFRCLDEENMDSYHHGEGLERCGVDNGLLCIIQDHLGSKKLEARSNAEFSNYHWMDSSPPAPNTESTSETYKFGDKILFFDMKSEMVGPISIPGSSSCWKEPIKFLRSTKAKCLRTMSNLCLFNNDLLAKFTNAQVLPSPSQIEKKEMMHGFGLKVQSCKQAFFNCTPLDAEAEATDCFDVIHLEFSVNDTSLVSGTVSLIANDEMSCLSDDLEPHAKVVQVFEVKFRNINEKNEKRVRTHYRGYKDEDIIYISRQFLRNESIPSGEKYLEFFHENDTEIDDFSLKIPRSVNGMCILSKKNYDLVRFNENSLTSCKVLIEKNETMNETFCQQMQLQLSNYVFNLMNLTFNGTSVSYAQNILVSKYYPPNYEAWVKLDILGVPSTSTELQTAANNQFCTNIFREVKFSFYSSRQNFIERLSVEFGIADFLLAMDNENQTIAADISIKSQFFNHV